jgi:hypothetical protein
MTRLIIFLVSGMLCLVLGGASGANELVNKKLLCKGLGKWVGTFENSPHGLHFESQKKIKFYTPPDITYPNMDITEVTLEYLSTAKEIFLWNPKYSGGVSILNRQSLILNADTSEPKKCEIVSNNYDFKANFSRDIKDFKKEIKLKNKI